MSLEIGGKKKVGFSTDTPVNVNVGSRFSISNTGHKVIGSEYRVIVNIISRDLCDPAYSIVLV